MAAQCKSGLLTRLLFRDCTAHTRSISPGVSSMTLCSTTRKGKGKRKKDTSFPDDDDEGSASASRVAGSHDGGRKGGKSQAASLQFLSLGEVQETLEKELPELAGKQRWDGSLKVSKSDGGPGPAAVGLFLCTAVALCHCYSVSFTLLSRGLESSSLPLPPQRLQRFLSLFGYLR